MKKFMLVALVLLVVGLPSCDLLKSSLGGTVEGTVSDASNGFVILISNIDDLDNIQDLTESGLSALTSIVKGFGIIGNDGSYEVLAVPEGSFYVVAAVDGNGNNTLDSTDMIGWYGKDTTFSYVDTTTSDTLSVTITIPEQITVADKETKTGINITTLVSKDYFEKYYDIINQ